MTYAELVEKRDEVLEQIAAGGGITSTTVDGMTVTVDQNKQLAALEAAIEKAAVRQCVGLPIMRSKVVSRGLQ